MRSAAAIRSWGEKVPVSLEVTTRDALVAEHGETWLRDAECVVRSLDWRAFTQGSFHVIDGRDIGMPATGYMGMTVGAHLHQLARDYLPQAGRDAVAAVAVHVDAVARNTVSAACPNRVDASKRIGAAVACIAAHEYAHHVVAVVEGYRLPPTASIEGTVGRLRDKGHDKQANSRSHGAPWCRAYGHLVARAAYLPRHDVWTERYRVDLRAATAVDPDAVLDALRCEFARFSSDDALADVLRTPAPSEFLELFDNQPAALPALTKE